MFYLCLPKTNVNLNRITLWLVVDTVNIKTLVFNQLFSLNFYFIDQKQHWVHFETVTVFLN